MKEKNSEAGGLRFSFLIPVFLLVNFNFYFNNISTNARQVLFRYSLVVQYLAPTAIYNPVLMLPLPDLAGNAVLVWYSMPKAYPQPLTTVLLSWA